MIRRPPRSTLFPSPTLFRSQPPPALGTPPEAVNEPFTVMLWGITTDTVKTWLREFEGGDGDVESNELHRSEEHTSELQSPCNLVCRLLLEKKKITSSTSLAPTPTDSVMWQTQPVPVYTLLISMPSPAFIISSPRSCSSCFTITNSPRPTQH